jgi:hypothetical protein
MMRRVGIATKLAGILAPSSPSSTSDAPASLVPAVSAPVAVPGARLAADIDPLNLTVLTGKAGRLALSIARAIPSVRRAEHFIATIGTFGLAGYAGGRRLAEDDGRVAWLRQPEQRVTRQATINRTVSDVVWYDRAVWRPVDRTLLGATVAVERLGARRVDTVPHPLDPDLVETWIVDGQTTSADKLVVFDGAGLGGLAWAGYELLNIYGQLQTAAGRYARSPHPYAILKNLGTDLEKDEITELLDAWELARETRSIGYTNDQIDYQVMSGSWSARELQLVEAREHAALETARLFGLPAWTLDAKSGDSMTYGNVTEKRRDAVEALRPWMTVLEQTISLDDRTGARTSGLLLPRGVTAAFDSDAYTRDDATTRMATWTSGLAAGILDLERDVVPAEPLIRK